MHNTTENNDDWLFEITPKNKLFSLNLKEVWEYRDLLMLFVKRNIIMAYKQTILGPLWYLIEPLFTSVIFTLIFNNVANIPTGTVPPFLFNLAGITIWNYFKACFFRYLKHIFGQCGNLRKSLFSSVNYASGGCNFQFGTVRDSVVHFYGIFPILLYAWCRHQYQ